MAALQTLYVKPTSNTTCSGVGVDPCLTLNEYAENSDQYFNDSTDMVFLAGDHFLNKSFSISINAELRLVGDGSPENLPRIICHERVGWELYNAVAVYIGNISVISCGKQTSVSYPAYGLKTYLSAFFIFDINVFQMINVLVQDSLGRAISAFNCSSIVLQNISFKMNGRNMTSTSETNCNSIHFNQSFHSIPFGGAIAVNSSKIRIHDVKFLDNGAVFGGAIYTEESHITLEGDVIFSNNSAECGGGTIMSFNSIISMEGNVSFFNNKAQAGGAILLTHIPVIITFHGMLPVSFPSRINMKRNSIVNFHNNSAALLGGAICAFIAEYISMEGKVSFLNNKAGLNGGAIFANEMYIVMEGNGIFIANEAKNGGTVFLFYSTCYLRNDLNFTGNHAHSQGGVIVAQGSNINVEGTSYIYTLNNTASLGEVIYLEYNSHLTVDRTAKFIAQHNKAKRGGVIYVRDSTYVITCITTALTSCPLQFHIPTLRDLSNILSNILENSANESGNVIYIWWISLNMSYS